MDVVAGELLHVVRQSACGQELVELVEGVLVAIERGRGVVAHGPEITQRFGHHSG